MLCYGRVRAVNTHGESAWSEQLSVTTQIDVAQIPTPEAIFFEKSSRSTSFKVATYPLPLAARLEVLAEDGGWQHLRTVSLRARPYKFSVNPPTHFQNVRVRICLESDDMLCGAYNEASVVDKIQVWTGHVQQKMQDVTPLMCAGAPDLQLGRAVVAAGGDHRGAGLQPRHRHPRPQVLLQTPRPQEAAGSSVMIYNLWNI